MHEIEDADFVVVVGADPLNEAAMSALAIRQAARKEAAVVVIDPRPVSLPLDFEHIAVCSGSNRDLPGNTRTECSGKIPKFSVSKSRPVLAIPAFKA